MLALAGNLSIQISIELRSRSLIFSWIKKSSTISCCRAYQSSGPVRYTPKKYSLGRENQNSQHTKSSKEKAIDRSSDSSFSKATFSHDRTVTHRLSNANDGSQYQFSSAERISDAETMNSSNMIGGMVEFSNLEDDTGHDQEVMDHHLIDEAEQHNGEFNISDDNGVFEKDATHAGKTKQDAEKMAVEVLATRAFTTVELQKKLNGKKFPPDIIKAVIADFQDRGMLNDYLYAESFSQSKWHCLSWGPRRIKQALLRKGVSEADAEKAMKQVFENNDSDGNRDIILGMSKVSMDRLLTQASKQWLRGQDVPLETRKSRILRWLQYRGFNWQVTNFILRKLESQYPP
ncbi:uncharacterized protein LOC131257896 [Magnolia sinica]|uniref:uncharacterized protein LOC131257896 n=1 Tax=Magnolia sinica TaxID=86752 RepID=UPI002658E1C9|nr:uncharacterized protein LOC131257896 [Magnolia sinica]